MPLASIAIEDEDATVYAFDCHTQKGREMGKTKAEFFRDELAALKPFQPGLFDALIDGRLTAFAPAAPWAFRARIGVGK